MTEHQTLTVRLHPNDNVVTARIDLLPNTAVAGEGIACGARIPAGHKVATRPIANGEPVRKYDQIIGFASADIAPGEHVHTHNVEMRDFARDYAFGADVKPTAFVPEDRAGELRRLPARQRQGRHAQLHRRAVDRQLLGDGLPPHRRDLPERRAGRLPATSMASSR